MYRQPKAKNRRPEARSKAKLLTGLRSGQGKNPAQLPKLRGEKKEEEAVEDSPSQLRLENTPTSKKKRHLTRTSKKRKKEEEVVEDSRSKLRLDNTPTSKKKRRRTRSSKCPICLRKSCNDIICPYLDWVPPGVTNVGKGYELACRVCGHDDNMCGHNVSHARSILCSICFGHGHDAFACPMQEARAKLHDGLEWSESDESDDSSVLYKSYASDSSDSSDSSNVLECRGEVKLKYFTPTLGLRAPLLNNNRISTC